MNGHRLFGTPGQFSKEGLKAEWKALHGCPCQGYRCSPRQGVSSVAERGHRLSERRPPFLGEEQATGQGANPRISNFVSLIAGILIAVLIAAGAFILLVSQQ